MITEEEQKLEDTANLQIKVMREVLNELMDTSGIGEYPEGFYWFRYVDYAEIDKHGYIEYWERGFRNDPDTRTSFTMTVDIDLLASGDVEAFKARFRAQHLPWYNLERQNKVNNKRAEILKLTQEIEQFTGDIE